MKIILVFVASLDGKVTKWGHPMVSKWSSVEDQRYFTGIIKNARLVVMGSNTFNADPIKPLTNRLMIIMTRYPEKYRNFEIEGQIIFSAKSPSELTHYYKGEGYEEMVVVGGPHIATSFLKEQMIDEIWLTVEPLIFGIGANFVIEEKLDIRLQLLSSEIINARGTLINKYAIIRKST